MTPGREGSRKEAGENIKGHRRDTVPAKVLRTGAEVRPQA